MNMNELSGRMYHNQRTNSKQYKRQPPQYTLTEFRAWLSSTPKFGELYIKWEESGFDKMQAPSADRINNKEGYILSNLQLMSWQNNYNKGIGERSKVISQYDSTNTLINIFKSCSEASRVTSINQGNISSCCNGRLPKAGGYIWKYIK